MVENLGNIMVLKHSDNFGKIDLRLRTVQNGQDLEKSIFETSIMRNFKIGLYFWFIRLETTLIHEKKLIS